MSENFFLYIMTIILSGMIIVSIRFNKQFALINTIVFLLYNIPLYYMFFFNNGGGSGFLWWFYLVCLTAVQLIIILIFIILKFIKSKRHQFFKLPNRSDMSQQRVSIAHSMIKNQMARICLRNDNALDGADLSP